MSPASKPYLVLSLALAIPTCTEQSSPEPAVFVEPRLGPELLGEVANEWLGYSLASAGDVTGDGQVDLVLSEHASGAGGRVTVVEGPLRAGDPWRERIMATFVGEYGFANLGDWLVHAGGCDVDGDGIDDLVLGSPFADLDDVANTPIRSGDNAGKAYLVLGGPTLHGDHGILDAADVQLLGEDAFDTAGSAVACLGDLDGDGIDDLAVAAKGSARGGGEDTGAVYLLYGRPMWPARLGLADADAVLTGAEAYEQAGVAISPAGDVDGNGYADLLVGAPNADRGGDDGEDDGSVYLVLNEGARLRGLVPLAEQATRLRGHDPGARLGWSLAPLGDFDGDGLDDFALGSATSPVSPELAGVVWLVRGGDGLVGDVDLEQRATRIAGLGPGELLGIAVAGVGDVSGDGLADLVIGATEAEHDGVVVGRVSLVAGHPEPGASLELAEAPWHAFGGEVGEGFGETIVPLGDIDGDGRPDFAATAKGWSERRGRVQLVFAGDPDETSAPQ